jgi:hypothetical protein
VLSLATVVGSPAADSVPEGWFVWPMVEPASGTALDASGLNSVRGEKLPRLSVRDGKFTTPDGRPLRFWGANLSAAEALPPSEVEARTLARRLAKGGVNIARLHHLDNPWGASLWPKNRPVHRELDPAPLDQLHRLIAALRDEGIYSNLNLKVSKTLVPADGFADTVTQFPNFQKRVDIYDRRMIDLQKDYARRVLTTKNPYTGLTPAEDPAIGIVEINNENSLLGFWTRDLGRGLDKFPEPFRRDLQAQWNAWLTRHYADDEALARAWTPEPRSGESLIAPDALWHKRITEGAAASLMPGADATELEIRVTATSTVAHHVQLSTFGLPITDGEVYTVEFQAKADQSRQLGVGVSADTSAEPSLPWRSLGLLESVGIGVEWQTVRLSFAAHSVGGAAGQLSFSAGQAPGVIHIQGLRLVRGAPDAGLRPGQSPRDGSVPIPTAPSPRQWADWITFLADTERTFAEEMRAFLKDELHVQAPIVCSQIDYGGLTGMNREQSMEFADTHVYWQHPEFIGRDWDPANWTIKNSPQLAEFGDRSFGEFGALALVRVAGKPFTLGEYDHAAPSEFVCEMYPTLASFAARQDWDMVYPFSIAAYGAANPDGRIRDFFDQMNHPAKWSQSPFAARLFRGGLVAPASLAAELHLGSPLWAEQPHADVLWRQLIPGSLDFLNVRYAVSDHPGESGAKARLSRSGAPANTTAPVRLIDAPQGKAYVIDSEQAAAAVGFLGGATIEAGPLTVQCDRFGRDFASVTAVALDGRPLRESTRILVTVAARAENQAMVWNAAHNSVGTQLGHGPTIAERVPATLTLAGAANRRLYALAPDGSRTKSIPPMSVGNALRFQVTAEHATLHYEIAAD